MFIKMYENNISPIFTHLFMSKKSMKIILAIDRTEPIKIGCELKFRRRKSIFTRLYLHPFFLCEELERMQQFFVLFLTMQRLLLKKKKKKNNATSTDKTGNHSALPGAALAHVCCLFFLLFTQLDPATISLIN
jgi:hypothetical protein